MDENITWPMSSITGDGTQKLTLNVSLRDTWLLKVTHVGRPLVEVSEIISWYISGIGKLK